MLKYVNYYVSKKMLDLIILFTLFTAAILTSWIWIPFLVVTSFIWVPASIVIYLILKVLGIWAWIM